MVVSEMARERSVVAVPPVAPLLPLLVASAVIAGLALVLAMTPIGSGDYGQWLMTSRLYLGQSVPDYRDLGDVPAVVPLLLAGLQVVLPDPMVALHVFAALLLAFLGASFYLLGAVALQSRWAGAVAVVLGLLVTDRFTELFAFGGLFQAAALASLGIGVAAFSRAGRTPSVLRWWWLGVAAFGLSALTHVGTGLIAVPVGGAIAALAVLAVAVGPAEDRERILRRLRAPAAAMLLVGLYWLVILVPASGEYVSNPASLAYRGVDRLFEELVARWPTMLVLVLGAATLALGALRGLVLRRFDGYLVLATWAGLTWAVLVYSVVSGSATDYPRFSTPLLAPLVVGAAGGVLWTLGTFARYLREMGMRQAPETVIAVVVVAAVLVAGPLAIDRYSRQADFYELRDADALAAAATWLDGTLEDGQAILTDTRDGKWVEGLTGREALFSQSVRYAFRPSEWQRIADGDALLRSTQTLTSGYVAAQFTDSVHGEAGRVPTGLLVRANHGGEMVDLLRLPPATTRIGDAGSEVAAAALAPLRATHFESEREASVRTVWGDPADPAFSYTQTVTAFLDGTTLRVTQSAPGYRLSSELTPAFGITITSLEIDDDGATACFTQLGQAAPCIRIRAAQPDTVITATPQGGLHVRGGSSDRLDLLITALTAGDASVGLSLLDPAELVEAHAVGAALLYEPDPAYEGRLSRLRSLGFEEAHAFGPYRALVRREPASE